MAVASAGHMQTICTSLQTDNHINTSSLNFYRLDALPDAQPTVSKPEKNEGNWQSQVHPVNSHEYGVATVTVAVATVHVTAV